MHLTEISRRLLKAKKNATSPVTATTSKINSFQLDSELQKRLVLNPFEPGNNERTKAGTVLKTTLDSADYQRLKNSSSTNTLTRSTGKDDQQNLRNYDVRMELTGSDLEPRRPK